jgi:Leucine-rich repeat (LRR) protein
MFRIIENGREPKYLDISPGSKRKIPADIAQFHEISDIKISDSSINDVTNLKSLKNIRSITFNNCDFKKIPKGLTELSTLRCLTFYYCKNFKETAGIEHLAGLKEIAFIGNPKLTTINGLKGLSNLTDLIIFDSWGLREVPDMDSLVNLIRFKIGMCGQIDLSNMNSLVNIRKFDFWAYDYLDLNKISNVVINGAQFEAELSDWLRVKPTLDLSSAMKSVLADNDIQFMDIIDSSKATKIAYNYFINREPFRTENR